MFFLLTASYLLPRQHVNPEVLSLSKSPEVLRAIRHIPFDYLMEREGRIYIVAGPSDIETIKSLGLPYRLETTSYRDRTSMTMGIEGGINGEFHTYAELERDIFALQEKFPSLVKIHDIGDSIEGRNLYALEITSHPDQEVLRPRSLFIGCHHAREWISVEVPYLLAVHLCENYPQDGRIKALLDSSEIWIIPLLNPDGLEYSIYFYRYWRKNRRMNSDGSYGVDLNRNYGYKWGYSDEGSSGNPNSGVYRGAGPFSEPETQAVRSLLQQYRFETLVSYHNFSQIIIFPWGYTTEQPSQYDLMFRLSQKMSDFIFQVNGRRYEYGQASDGLYLTNGDTTDWAYSLFSIPSFTIELPPLEETLGGFFNAENEIQPIFLENLPAALYLMEWAVATWSGEAAKPKPSLESDLRTIEKTHKKIIK